MPQRPPQRHHSLLLVLLFLSGAGAGLTFWLQPVSTATPASLLGRDSSSSPGHYAARHGAGEGTPLVWPLGMLANEPNPDGSWTIQLTDALLAADGPLWRQAAPMQLTIPLPDAPPIVAELRHFQRQTAVGVSASGYVQDHRDSLVTLGHRGRALVLAINHRPSERIWELHTAPTGEHRLVDATETARRRLGEGETATPRCACGAAHGLIDQAEMAFAMDRAVEPLAISHDDPIETPLRVFVSPSLASDRGLDALTAESLSHIAFLNNAYQLSSGLEQIEATLLECAIAEGYTEQSDYPSDLSAFGAWLGDRFGAATSSVNSIGWTSHRSAIGCNDSILMQDKSFSGTVGIAWIGTTPAVISGNYGSVWAGSVDLSHEYGHNLGCRHDSGSETGNYIMNSGVVNVDSFSPTSIDVIENTVSSTSRFPIGRYVDTIVDVTVDGEASTGSIPFFLGGTDDVGSISLSATSANDALISDGGIVFAGDGKVRTVEAYLNPGLTGSADITVSVDMDGQLFTKTFTVTVVSNGAIGGAGSVTVASADQEVDEAIGSFTASIDRVGGLEGAVEADWSLVGGSATLDADVTAANGTLSWPDGELGGKTVTITIIDDENEEDPESFTLQIDAVRGADTGSDSSATFTIIDEDGANDPALPMAYLPCDEGSGSTAADATGNGHDAALESGVAWDTGQRDQSLVFADGQRGSIADFDYTRHNAFTVAFAFRATDRSGDGYQYLFSHGTAGEANSLSIYLSESSNTNANAVLRSYLVDDDDPSSPDSLDVALDYDDSDWHVVAIVVDSDGTRVYLDGSEAARSASLGGDAFDPASELFIGGRSDADPERYFIGQFDELYIWRRALSGDEIAGIGDEILRSIELANPIDHVWSHDNVDGAQTGTGSTRFEGLDRFLPQRFAPQPSGVD